MLLEHSLVPDKERDEEFGRSNGQINFGGSNEQIDDVEGFGGSNEQINR